MYFSGTIAVDPSEATKIIKQEPAGFAAKILGRLGGRTAGKKIEIETFTALTIMQRLYRVLKSLNIRNVVTLKQDDVVFYEDRADKNDDLDEVMMKYELENDDLVSVDFKELSMTLEHTEENIDYIIKVMVQRKHAAGIYPVSIRLKGLVDETVLTGKAGSGPESIKTALKQAGESFIHFLNRIDFYFRKNMSVDDIKTEHDVNLVINREDYENFQQQQASVKELPAEFTNIIKDLNLGFDLNKMLSGEVKKGLLSTSELEKIMKGKGIVKIEQQVFQKSITYKAGDNIVSRKIKIGCGTIDGDKDADDAIIVPFESEE